MKHKKIKGIKFRYPATEKSNILFFQPSLHNELKKHSFFHYGYLELLHDFLIKFSKKTYHNHTFYLICIK